MESRGASLDEQRLRLTGASKCFRGPRLVVPKRPKRDSLESIKCPVMVLIAEHSRAIDSDKELACAEGLPGWQSRVLVGATHHTLPSGSAPQIASTVVLFLNGLEAPRRIGEVVIRSGPAE